MVNAPLLHLALYVGGGWNSVASLMGEAEIAIIAFLVWAIVHMNWDGRASDLALKILFD